MKNSTPYLVTCTKCNGSGKTELSDEYLTVLRVTAGMRTITAAAVTERIKWKGNPTAICNRLKDLLKLGFYSRRRVSRTFVYKQIKY